MHRKPKAPLYIRVGRKFRSAVIFIMDGNGCHARRPYERTYEAAIFGVILLWLAFDALLFL